MPRELIGSLEISAESGLLDVGAARGARRVDVDRDQRFGVVDDDRAARGQRHLARERGFDLVLDLKAREQGNVILVEFDAADVVGHHVTHERTRLLVNVLGVDQDLADVLVEVVADGADHQARFLVNQKRTALPFGGVFDLAPQLQQVLEVPVEFLDAAADAGGARDHAHAVRDLELVDGFAQLRALLALDAARHAAAARVVGHQHEIAAGEADEVGEGGALGAAFVLVDLDDHLLAFLERILDAGAADIDALLEVSTRDFLEGEETVPLAAVFYERSFKARFDAGDDTLVDVAFALLFTGGFDVEVEQLLAIDDRDAQLFGLRRVEQHAFHFYLLPRSVSRDGQTRARRERRTLLLNHSVTKPDHALQ